MPEMKVNLDQLMKTYKAGTPGIWKNNGNGISSDELLVLDAVLEGTTIYDACAKIFIDREDLDLIVILHNSFPAIYERLKVAEKERELLMRYFKERCPFIRDEETCALMSCDDCITLNIRQKALAELGIKENEDGK